MKRQGTSAAVMAFAVLIAGCGGSSDGGGAPAKSSAPNSINVHGTITLSGDSDTIDWSGGDGTPPDDAQADDGYTCEGTGGFDDITSGAQVVISSDTGNTLGIGSLASDGGLFTGSPVLAKCVIEWTVRDVSTSEKFYNIKIGHRDGPKWTLKQLNAGPQLTLDGS